MLGELKLGGGDLYLSEDGGQTFGFHLGTFSEMRLVPKALDAEPVIKEGSVRITAIYPGCSSDLVEGVDFDVDYVRGEVHFKKDVSEVSIACAAPVAAMKGKSKPKKKAQWKLAPWMRRWQV